MPKATYYALEGNKSFESNWLLFLHQMTQLSFYWLTVCSILACKKMWLIFIVQLRCLLWLESWIISNLKTPFAFWTDYKKWSIFARVPFVITKFETYIVLMEMIYFYSINQHLIHSSESRNFMDTSIGNQRKKLSKMVFMNPAKLVLYETCWYQEIINENIQVHLTDRPTWDQFHMKHRNVIL